MMMVRFICCLLAFRSSPPSVDGGVVLITRRRSSSSSFVIFCPRERRDKRQMATDTRRTVVFLPAQIELSGDSVFPVHVNVW